MDILADYTLIPDMPLTLLSCRLSASVLYNRDLGGNSGTGSFSNGVSDYIVNMSVATSDPLLEEVN